LGQALRKSVRVKYAIRHVACDLKNQIPKLRAHKTGQRNSKQYASRSLQVRLPASPYCQRSNIETAQSPTLLWSSSTAQDIGGTARFPGTMKLVRVPDFK